jgi:hypothetical protein
LESNWGKSGLTKKSNNLFGIKDFSGKGKKYKTKEFYNGKWVTVDAPFKEYDSWYDSIHDHSALILRGTKDKPKRYHAVIGEKDYKKAAKAIHAGGYATDPNYPQLLINIIEKRNLHLFDSMTVEEVDAWASSKPLDKKQASSSPLPKKPVAVKPKPKPVLRPEAKIQEKKEEDVMILTDSQWKQLVEELKQLHQKGLFSSDEWIQKALKKKLTISELTYLNTIIINRK